MPADDDLWYCEELRRWVSEPEEDLENEDPGTYTLRRGKKVNLADYVKATDVIEMLDNQDELTNEDGDMCVADYVTAEHTQKLDAMLKQWASEINYPLWLYDSRGEKMEIKIERS